MLQGTVGAQLREDPAWQHGLWSGWMLQVPRLAHGSESALHWSLESCPGCPKSGAGDKERGGDPSDLLLETFLGSPLMYSHIPDMA